MDKLLTVAALMQAEQAMLDVRNCVMTADGHLREGELNEAIIASRVRTIHDQLGHLLRGIGIRQKLHDAHLPVFPMEVQSGSLTQAVVVSGSTNGTRDIIYSGDRHTAQFVADACNAYAQRAL